MDAHIVPAPKLGIAERPVGIGTSATEGTQLKVNDAVVIAIIVCGDPMLLWQNIARRRATREKRERRKQSEKAHTGLIEDKRLIAAYFRDHHEDPRKAAQASLHFTILRR